MSTSSTENRVQLYHKILKHFSDHYSKKEIKELDYFYEQNRDEGAEGSFFTILSFLSSHNLSSKSLIEDQTTAFELYNIHEALIADLKKAPLSINKDNLLLSSIAKWRLSIGR